MFSPNEVEAVPKRLEKLFRKLQLNIMTDITRKIVYLQNISRASDWQLSRLYELGMSKKEIQKFIKDTLNKSDEEINRIFNDVIQSGYARNESLYTSVGKDFIPYEENTALQQLVSSVQKQTAEDSKNITQSLGFAVKQPDGKLKFKPIANYYQDTLDKASVDIISGAFDYNTVLERTVSEMINSGLRTVDYASGWNNRVDVAVRRAVLTGFNQVIAKVNEDNAKQLETDTYEVSWHSGHRPSHWWGGRWYTYKELVDICGLGTVEGLCGANCYHSYSPVIPGISKPTYTAEQLEKMEDEEQTKHKYGDKEYTKYEALQKQRKLETAMRAQKQKIKLLEEGNADENVILAAKAKYFKASDEYVKFSETMGLPQQRERVNIGVSDTVKSATSVANSENGGIIESEKNYAKATEVFSFSNASENVSPQSIVDTLEQNDIGKETIRQLNEKGIKPILDYDKKQHTNRGEQQGKTIKIFMGNIPNARIAAQTVIHETTHAYYDIGNCQWAEAVCFAREKMFLVGRPLTVQEKRYVVRLAKDNYPELNWKKGGYGYDKRK